MREVLIGVPADKLVIIANASNRVDTLARIDTERGLLAAHGEGRVRSGNVGVEEHAVLDLNPLGIDRHAALRHGIEGVCLGACLVDVPAREDVACVWIGFIGVERADVRAVGKRIRRIELAPILLVLDRVAIAVEIAAIHEVDNIRIARVEEADAAHIKASLAVPVRRVATELRVAVHVEPVEVPVDVAEVGIDSVNQGEAAPLEGDVWSLARQRLDVVPHRPRLVLVLVYTERRVLCGHDIEKDDDVVEQLRVLGHPALAMIVGSTVVADDGELIPDWLLIEACDGLDGGPAAALGIAGAVIARPLCPT